MGVSGAIWIDADGDGKISTAQQYARELVTRFRQDLEGLFNAMSAHDEAVAVQAAALLHQSGVDLSGPVATAALTKASSSIKEGFKKFMQGLKQSKNE